MYSELPVMPFIQHWFPPWCSCVRRFFTLTHKLYLSLLQVCCSVPSPLHLQRISLLSHQDYVVSSYIFTMSQCYLASWKNMSFSCHTACSAAIRLDTTDARLREMLYTDLVNSRSDVSYFIQALCFSSSVGLAFSWSSLAPLFFSGPWCASLLLKLLNTAGNVSFHSLSPDACISNDFLFACSTDDDANHFLPVLVWIPALAILSSDEFRNVIIIRHLAVLNSYITDETGMRNWMELL